MIRRKWRVAAVALSAMLVFGVPSKAQVHDNKDADTYEYGQIDDSLLANTVLQPEPEPDDEEPAAQPPARRRLFSRGLLGTRQPTRLRRAPAMFGDLFFGGPGFFSSGFSTIAIAGGDRRFKISENNQPLPTDRVFYNFNHFHNAVLADGAMPRDENVGRHVFGIEKTWHGGSWSTELRVPIVDGLDNIQNSFSGGNEGVEFGNMSLTVKHLLSESECSVWSIGMGMVFPTGPDGVLNFGATNVFTVENTSFHLQPFIGWLYTPRKRCFFQGFLQLDFDTNGYRVTPGFLATAGTRLQEQSLLMVDGKLGYWLHDDPCARFITAVAPFVELHYTTTMQNADTFSGLGNPFNHVDVLNMTGGLHVELGDSCTVNAGVVVPLRDKEEKLFDAEFGIQVTRFF